MLTLAKTRDWRPVSALWNKSSSRSLILSLLVAVFFFSLSFCYWMKNEIIIPLSSAPVSKSDFLLCAYWFTLLSYVQSRLRKTNKYSALFTIKASDSQVTMTTTRAWERQLRSYPETVTCSYWWLLPPPSLGRFSVFTNLFSLTYICAFFLFVSSAHRAKCLKALSKHKIRTSFSTASQIETVNRHL